MQQHYLQLQVSEGATSYPSTTQAHNNYSAENAFENNKIFIFQNATSNLSVFKSLEAISIS